MNRFLLCLILPVVLSCTNSAQDGANETVGKTGAPGYLEDDLPFIQKADNICRAIDAENTFEQVKNDIFTDLDGQTYDMIYKGYSKGPSEHVAKIIITLLLGGKNSAKSTIYYTNGAILKGTAEIFADDTVSTAFYYDADKMIYPQQEGMEKAAQKLRDKSIGLKNYFSEATK